MKALNLYRKMGFSETVVDWTEWVQVQTIIRWVPAPRAEPALSISFRSLFSKYKFQLLYLQIHSRPSNPPVSTASWSNKGLIKTSFASSRSTSQREAFSIKFTLERKRSLMREAKFRVKKKLKNWFLEAKIRFALLASVQNTLSRSEAHGSRANKLLSASWFYKMASWFLQFVSLSAPAA